MGNGKILNGSLSSGYRTLNLHLEASNGTIYMYRELANFAAKRLLESRNIVHINQKKSDNNYTNLKWATIEEVGSHQQNSVQKITNNTARLK